MSDIPDNKHTRHQFEAAIGSNLSFMSYLGQYQRAFEALIEHVHVSGFSVDRVAYPILFIARHCIELGFKTNIRYFAQYSGKKDYTTGGTHDLVGLFGGFKLHVTATIESLRKDHDIIVDKADKKEFNNYCEKVNQLVTTLHALDKNSDSFRYPVDKDNKSSFEPTTTINLLDVKKLYEESLVLLVYTASVFDKYTAVIDERKEILDDIYQQELREHYRDVY
jgi:hypothetical protein